MHFPKLIPASSTRIITQSALVEHTQRIELILKKVNVAELSKTGNIVNQYEAVRLARAEQATAAKNSGCQFVGDRP
ncbi:hypothetical protein GO755_07120 [Spirosoma sp. HMF4905]|uniref:Uncharacterized protein n=1 Tax=Spirosoma arboris TaxID=2682092 RepID=A0A7K1S876_9BACT|nr:hypothetical protein [Spirosoma arboris]MVM29796.1 hypothetical protein [Spirosoma arboris]